MSRRTEELVRGFEISACNFEFEVLTGIEKVDALSWPNDVRVVARRIIEWHWIANDLRNESVKGELESGVVTRLTDQ